MSTEGMLRVRVTHVLLSTEVLLRRADSVEVIGRAFEARALALGCGAIAARLGRARETVRGWIRRFGARVEAVRAWFTRLLCAVMIDPVIPEPAGSEWADALTRSGWPHSDGGSPLPR
jgi:hypothetical protein